MSVAPSMTWPLVAISPSLRMKKPVPIPRTGVSTGPLPPCPYMRSRKSRNGSLPPARAVVATMPTTAGIEEEPEFVLGARLLRRPAPHFDVSEELRHHLPGALRIAFAAACERVEDGLAGRRLPGHGRRDRLLGIARVESTLKPDESER